MRTAFLTILMILLVLPVWGVYHKVGGFAVPDDYVYQVTIDDDLLYYNGHSFGVIDVSDIDNPVLLGYEENNFGNFILSGDYIYTVNTIDMAYCLSVVDASDPTDIQVLNTYIGSDKVFNVSVEGDIGCLSEYHYLEMIDLSDPVYPEHLATIELEHNSISNAICGSTLCLASEYGGLRLFDISTPSAPEEVGYYDTNGDAYFVMAEDDVAYVLTFESELHIIDISDPEAPAFIAQLPVTDSYGRLTKIEDRLLFSSNCGVVVLDLSNPSAPYVLGEYTTNSSSQDATIHDGVMIIADFVNGMQFVDVTDPDNQAIVGMLDDPGCAIDLEIVGDLAYAASSSYGLAIYDISDPENPQFCGVCDTPGSARNVEVVDDFAYVAGNTYSLSIIDVSDPFSPAYVGGYDGSGYIGNVCYHEGVVILANSSSSAFSTEIIDVSDPENPQVLVSSGSIMSATDVVVRDDLMYLSGYGGKLCVYDIDDPALPDLLGECDVLGSLRTIELVGDYAYMTNETFGVTIIDVTDPTAPFFVDALMPRPDCDIVEARVLDGKLYASDSAWNEISVYDLADPAAPVLEDQYLWNHTTCAFGKVDDYLFAAESHNGVFVLDWQMAGVSEDPAPSPMKRLTCCPNPFNPETTIVYSLDQACDVELTVYNIRGQRVAQLVDERQSSGEHTAVWRGRDATGAAVASGVYFARIKHDNATETTKLLLLK